jgi:hypothetical protein
MGVCIRGGTASRGKLWEGQALFHNGCDMAVVSRRCRSSSRRTEPSQARITVGGYVAYLHTTVPRHRSNVRRGARKPRAYRPWWSCQRARMRPKYSSEASNWSRSTEPSHARPRLRVWVFESRTTARRRHERRLQTRARWHGEGLHVERAAPVYASWWQAGGRGIR